MMSGSCSANPWRGAHANGVIDQDYEAFGRQARLGPTGTGYKVPTGLML